MSTKKTNLKFSIVHIAIRTSLIKLTTAKAHSAKNIVTLRAKFRSLKRKNVIL